ncbi:hypothetical protein EVAR_45933_1 [Eumeta japonica]|uniref:Uncharacterized protein n=1 Tax=Eumeta variegata TaxID=151549 RepID=A0A4C1W670_EUMVA|nr:hypothetical protein EVAR_45933_1 [Eumeta japonica]
MSVVMGLNWVLELTSLIEQQRTLMMIADFCNTIITGLAVFVLFVCNKVTIMELSKSVSRNNISDEEPEPAIGVHRLVDEDIPVQDYPDDSNRDNNAGCNVPLDPAVANAWRQYKIDCDANNIKPKDLLWFRAHLADTLVNSYNIKFTVYRVQRMQEQASSSVEEKARCQPGVIMSNVTAAVSSMQIHNPFFCSTSLGALVNHITSGSAEKMLEYAEGCSYLLELRGGSFLDLLK